MERDRGLDALLELDGVTFFVDADGIYRVRFVVRRVPVSQERQHGLSYSLTLHGEKGERLVGFDNAHPVTAGSGPARRKSASRDHRHIASEVRPYAYRDAASLLSDFWEAVDAVLKEKGVLP